MKKGKFNFEKYIKPLEAYTVFNTKGATGININAITEEILDYLNSMMAKK